jgi:hypothetical protein
MALELQNCKTIKIVASSCSQIYGRRQRGTSIWSPLISWKMYENIKIYQTLIRRTKHLKVWSEKWSVISKESYERLKRKCISKCFLYPLWKWLILSERNTGGVLERTFQYISKCRRWNLRKLNYSSVSLGGHQGNVLSVMSFDKKSVLNLWRLAVIKSIKYCFL